MGRPRDFTRRMPKRRRDSKATAWTRVKGGFYPSVMEGVRASTVLLPFAARQAYRLYNSNAKKVKKIRKAEKTRKRRRNGTARRG